MFKVRRPGVGSTAGLSPRGGALQILREDWKRGISQYVPRYANDRPLLYWPDFPVTRSELPVRGGSARWANFRANGVLVWNSRSNQRNAKEPCAAPRNRRRQQAAKRVE